MNSYPYETELLMRLLLAVLCGALVGYERERHGISAGLRTNILVCVGAALMMIVSKYFYYKPGEIIDNIRIGLDPSRIAASIVTGVGFLGAGVIIKEKGDIRGLTTAATLWYNAGLGMACGHGMVVLPLFCTSIALVALTTLKKFGNRIPRDRYKVVCVECNNLDEQIFGTLKQHFLEHGVKVVDMNFRQKPKESVVIYEISIRGHWRNEELYSYVSGLSRFEFVVSTRLD